MTAAVGTGGVITPAQYAGGGGGGAVSSVFGRSGAVVALTGDYTYAQVGADQFGAAANALAAAEAFTVAGFAPLASPAFTGTPTAPPAVPGDTSTQLATDAFVAAAVTAGEVTAGTGLTKTGNTLSVTVPASPYASQTLVSPAASITFSSIPAGYGVLRLVVIGASAAVAEFDRWLVTVNGDTGTDYDVQAVSAHATTVAGSSLVGASNWRSPDSTAGDMPAASATSGVAGTLEITIPLYAGTTFQKSCQWRSGYSDGAVSLNDANVTNATVAWRSAAAITSIKVATFSGSNLVAGTTAYLYLS